MALLADSAYIGSEQLVRVVCEFSSYAVWPVPAGPNPDLFAEYLAGLGVTVASLTGRPGGLITIQWVVGCGTPGGMRVDRLRAACVTAYERANAERLVPALNFDFRVVSVTSDVSRAGDSGVPADESVGLLDGLLGDGGGPSISFALTLFSAALIGFAAFLLYREVKKA